jgi:hypothetical protein
MFCFRFNKKRFKIANEIRHLGKLQPPIIEAQPMKKRRDGGPQTQSAITQPKKMKENLDKNFVKKIGVDKREELKQVEQEQQPSPEKPKSLNAPVKVKMTQANRSQHFVDDFASTSTTCKPQGTSLLC